ncbi:MAG: hypothetical protein UY39_C0056G0006 [Candidatus Kaiserbacteria bacterium GW2011_GWC2_49_12]|uniref:Septum formation initiator n=2 Tax=Candidatus Kaiseribacteriota TaxID=1752734 RepID=A0A0G1ZDY6_9BACT|nr:MAG: hypothetical protein UY39_C0056G0006 [Candidatus Kaiserbacteria bacterium GW2011_GWC2_49_12]KKW17414.1 MAG: hypothetical protein UY59_C0037G0005 [Candidatus Kaiserbacteria bacterium GW2011_GWA1_50_28]
MLTGLVFVAASGVWNVYQKERESAALRAQVESEYAELRERETQLKKDIARLSTDRGMEEALRKQYALAEEGEGLIIIVEPPAAEPVHATSSVREWFENVFNWW